MSPPAFSAASSACDHALGEVALRLLERLASPARRWVRHQLAWTEYWRRRWPGVGMQRGPVCAATAPRVHHRDLAARRVRGRRRPALERLRGRHAPPHERRGRSGRSRDRRAIAWRPRPRRLGPGHDRADREVVRLDGDAHLAGRRVARHDRIRVGERLGGGSASRRAAAERAGAGSSSLQGLEHGPARNRGASACSGRVRSRTRRLLMTTDAGHSTHSLPGRENSAASSASRSPS